MTGRSLKTTRGARGKSRGETTERDAGHRRNTPGATRGASSVSAVYQDARPVPVLWLGLLLALVTVLAYWGVQRHDFVLLDDPKYVTNNAHIAQGITWHGLAWAFSSGYASNWHPLTWISHMADIDLFGLAPGGHHVMSVVLHVISTLLLFAAFGRMTGAWTRSAVVAALFAVHPMHVESVAWIAERKDVLSGLLWWCAILAYARYAARPSRARYAGLLITAALGLMAKPMVITLPVTLLLLDLWPLSRATPRADTTFVARWWPLVREKLPLFAMAAGSAFVTYVVQQRGGAIRGSDIFPLALRLENALVSIVAYALRMFWPVDLAVYYPHAEQIPAGEWLGALLIIVAISVAAIRLVRRAPYLAAGWFWFLITLMPVLGIVQVGTQAMADRYTYVPYVGLFVVVVWGAVDIAGRAAARAMLPVLALALIVACAIATRAQDAYWQDSVTLWAHTAAATDGANNYGAYRALGMALRDRGRSDESIDAFRTATRLEPSFADAQRDLAQALLQHGRAAEAVPPLLALAALDPSDAGAQRDLGFAYAQSGDANDAIPHYAESLRLEPDQPDVENNLASMLGEAGRTDEAIRLMTALVRAKPDYADAQNNFGLLLARTGQNAEALTHFANAVRLKPDLADAHDHLGLALANMGRLAEAQREIREAIRLAPGNALAHNNLGLVLAALDQLPAAIAEYDTAVRLDPRLPRARVNYGIALVRANRYDEAVTQFQAAVQLDPGNLVARQALASLARRGK